jgi:transcriptional regulator with XRE-family HTH domain
MTNDSKPSKYDEKRKEVFHLRLYLYRLRVRANLTPTAVARSLGIHKQHYYQLENGRRFKYQIDVVMLKRLADVLNTSFENISKLELEYQTECIENGIRLSSRTCVTTNPHKKINL